MILSKFTKSDVLRQNQWNFPFLFPKNDLTNIITIWHRNKKKCASLRKYFYIFHLLKLLVTKTLINCINLFEFINFKKDFSQNHCLRMCSSCSQGCEIFFKIIPIWWNKTKVLSKSEKNPWLKQQTQYQVKVTLETSF